MIKPADSKRPLKVFLCHASADKPKVRELYRYLKRRGMQPWLDEVNLIGGQDWQIEIPKALAASDVILVCLTTASIDKEGYVQKEIKFALDKALEMPEGRVFLIPVRFEECEIPFTLSRYQWVDLFNETGYSLMMKALKYRASQLNRAPTIDLPKKVVEEESKAFSEPPAESVENDTAMIFSRKEVSRVIPDESPYTQPVRLVTKPVVRGFTPWAVTLAGLFGFVSLLLCAGGLLWLGEKYPPASPTQPITVSNTPVATYTDTDQISFVPASTPTITLTPFFLSKGTITSDVQFICGNDVAFLNPVTLSDTGITLYEDNHANGVHSISSKYMDLPLMLASNINTSGTVIQSGFTNERTVIVANTLSSSARCVIYWESTAGYYGTETNYAAASKQGVGNSFMFWAELTAANLSAERSQFLIVVDPSTAVPKATRDTAPQNPTSPPPVVATPTL